MSVDGSLHISVGQSRTSRQWRTKEMLWSEFVQRLAHPVRTQETMAEYKAMKKSDQDEAKDVGGYTKGPVRGGRRRSGSIHQLYFIALDLDWPKEGLWNEIELLHEFACALHSTHSHRPDHPRLRLIAPLARPVTPDEWQAVARKLAEDLGIDQFDPTTFEIERLNYWPSIPRDADYVFHFQDGPWLNPDAYLARYDDWRDPTQWPAPEKEQSARARMAEKAEDPHTKRGIVGAFCRTYSIEEAIETFLSDVYEPVGEGRYTYKPGSTTGGLVLYEHGKFAYSHHGTDPVSGKLVNAFDLVRIHLFGERDDEAQPGTPTVRLPSYLAMVELATDDERVKQTLGREAQERAAQDFGEPLEESEGDEWMSKLELNKQGKVVETRHNILLILEHDPRLKGRIALNEFTGRPAVLGDLPWRKKGDRDRWGDRDDEALRHYLERIYGINAPGKTSDALGVLLERHQFHPIREYLESLEWDGRKRLDTLLVDYLGTEDSPYVRAVTRKALTAAVSRVMRPGCKWDYMLVLVGPQGIGKSYLLKLLGKEWFSDSVTTVQGKEAYEQLQGSWIIEMAELAATRRAEVEAIKHFLSKQEDIYRVPYGKQVSVFPRQCVFFGTTNDLMFLRDQTGNRRFWPVVVGENKPTKSLWSDLTDEELDQIWAEAVQAYKDGERLYLTPELESEARRIQEAHTQESEKAGAVREFLEMLLPADWEKRDIGQRRAFIHGGDFGKEEAGTIQRERVCVMEIWCELFFGSQKDLTRAVSLELHEILRNTPGWKPYTKGTGKLHFGPEYGYQRAYVRA